MSKPTFYATRAEYDNYPPYLEFGSKPEGYILNSGFKTNNGYVSRIALKDIAVPKAVKLSPEKCWEVEFLSISQEDFLKKRYKLGKYISLPFKCPYGILAYLSEGFDTYPVVRLKFIKEHDMKFSL